MKTFRKLRYLFLTASLASFLFFAGYSVPWLRETGPLPAGQNSRIELSHAFSSEYLHSAPEQVQSLHFYPVIHFFSGKVTGTELSPAILTGINPSNPGFVLHPSLTVFDKTCKLQI
jgi:hypothetical protein